MYIPPYFRNKNQDELLAFMKAHPLAVICSNGDRVPLATHLPFSTREEGEKIFLISHFALANPHARELQEGSDVLVIFSGPDAYISPSLYDKTENVPTWNYIAVHAEGRLHLDNSDEGREKVLLSMISAFEPAYMQQWEQLSRDYISRMIKGIIAFEIEVTKLEGKFKLSQNKTAAEQERIAASLSGAHAELSEQMKKNSPFHS